VTESAELRSFGDIVNILNAGDHLTTPELKQFVKDATKVIELFTRTEAYRLVMIDLIMKRGSAEKYLVARKELSA
jgi:hypothetical protein